MEGNKLDRNEHKHKIWQIVVLIIKVVWIIMMICACVAFVQVINAHAMTPYIDGSTGEWVICEIDSKDNAVDITDPPPIDNISVVLDEVDTLQQPELEYLGVFKISYYCKCGRCNGYDKYGNPRSYDRYGDPLIWGTVAVDPKVIPLQTHLVIDGYDMEFTARDTGDDWVQGKHIDMYVPVSHSEALKMAQGQKLKVWKLIQ